MNMEDLIDNGFVEEKEELIVTSRKDAKQLCIEHGITNECRMLNEFPSFVRFMNAGNVEAAARMVEQWIEDEAHTTIS